MFQERSEDTKENPFFVMEFGFENHSHTDYDHNSLDDLRKINFPFKDDGFQNCSKSVESERQLSAIETLETFIE